MTLPSPRLTRFDGVPRSQLESEIVLLETKLAQAERDRDAYLVNLTSTQQRCTELLTEVRAYRVLDAVAPGQRQVLAEVAGERARQDGQWGALVERADVPDGDESDMVGRGQLLEYVRKQVSAHCEKTGRSTCCWRHVLEEEACEALAATAPAHLRVELVQLAAVACLWIEVLDRRDGKEVT